MLKLWFQGDVIPNIMEEYNIDCVFDGEHNIISEEEYYRLYNLVEKLAPAALDDIDYYIENKYE